MARLGFDGGNYGLKGYDPRSKKHFFVRHAIAFLSESDWEEMAERGAIREGFVKVNGTPLAFGNAARRFLLTDPPRGASRYKKDYYGFALAYVMSELYQRDVADIRLFATHAPADFRYSKSIIEAATGIWQVTSRHGSLTFQIGKVNTIDEPVAGYSNFVLAEDGTERKKNPLANGMTLVVDVGGYTTDVAAIDPGGSIDPLTIKSKRTGALNVLSSFEDRLRSQYRDTFRDTMNIDPRRIEKALTDGFFPFGSNKLDCVGIAKQCKSELVNDVVQIIRGAGGVANFDYILLTGGGSQMIKPELTLAYPSINFIMSESEPDLMQFSNAFGATKLGRLMEKEGIW